MVCYRHLVQLVGNQEVCSPLHSTHLLNGRCHPQASWTMSAHLCHKGGQVAGRHTPWLIAAAAAHLAMVCNMNGVLED